MAVLEARDAKYDNPIFRVLQHEKRKAARRKLSKRIAEGLQNSAELLVAEEDVRAEIARLEEGQRQKVIDDLAELARFALVEAERIEALRLARATAAEMRKKMQKAHERAHRVSTDTRKQEWRRRLAEHDAELRARGLDPEWIGRNEAKPERWDLLGRPLRS